MHRTVVGGLSQMVMVAITLSWLLLCLSFSRQVSGAGSTCSGPRECPRFRVFYDQRDEEYLNSLTGAERLQFAATDRENLVRMIRPFQTGISQHGSGLGLDCLPWREKYSTAVGKVLWIRMWLDEFGSPTDCKSVLITAESYNSYIASINTVIVAPP